MVKYKNADLDSVFHALGDSTRRHLIEALAGEERTVGELAEPLEISLPAVSKHLGVLEGAGLLERRREGRSHYLRFNSEALNPASQWLEVQRRFWNESFDKLASYLETTSKKASPKKRTRKKK